MSQDDCTIKALHLSNAKILPVVIALLEEGHTVTLRLRGVSMRPFLEDNRDNALLTKPQSVNVGDVVLAEITPGNYVLHRIVNITGNDITLQGDGNLNTEQCKRNNIKAFAIGFYRKGSKQLDSTNSRKWKVYSFLWTNLRPIRRYLLFLYRKLWLRHS